MPNEKWWPDASIDVLRRRSDWLKRIRLFFEQHGVLEVETPVLSNASVP
ncbi:MAG: elongation factor P lysine(34) lysyltransferase, partial [Gammaproteobacteria bacterium]